MMSFLTRYRRTALLVNLLPVATATPPLPFAGGEMAGFTTG